MVQRFKHLLISLVCISLVAMPMQVSALDRYVDTSILTKNVNDIADWIESYGYISNKEIPTINYNKDSNTEGYIEVNKNHLEFSYFKVGKDLTEYSVYMDVDFPYSEQMAVEANIFMYDRYGDLIGGVAEVTATVDPSDYSYAEKSIKFHYDDDYSTINNNTVQKWCNETFDDAMDFWDELLEKKMDMSVVQLGFSELCNHDWDDVIIERPTATDKGEVESTCQWCGKIETTYVPADLWSANGKSASVKASVLKNKSVTVSRKLAISLSSCEYRVIT